MAEGFFINNVGFIIFIAIIIIFLVIKRSKLKIEGIFPFFYVLLYRTSLGLKKIKIWTKRHTRTYSFLAILSFIVGIFGCIASFLLLVWQLRFTIANKLTAGASLVLPLKTEQGLQSPIPVFYVPIIYWVIVLFVIVAVHELAHAIIAQKFKIPLKSSGFAFLGIGLPILPAAFVELDKEKMEKTKWWKQVSVLGAGSTSNLILGGIFLIIWIIFITAVFPLTMTPHTLEFNQVFNESSLRSYDITKGEILKINNKSTAEFLPELSKISPNQTLNITLRNQYGDIQEVSLKTYESETNKSRGLIGIGQFSINYKNKENLQILGNSPIYTEQILYYMWALNFGIGIINLLPLWITDGGQIVRVVSKKFFRKHKNLITNLISFISLILLILLIWPKILI